MFKVHTTVKKYKLYLKPFIFIFGEKWTNDQHTTSKNIEVDHKDLGTDTDGNSSTKELELESELGSYFCSF